MTKLLSFFIFLFILISFVDAQESTENSPQDSSSSAIVEEVASSDSSKKSKSVEIVEESDDEMLLIEEEDEFLISDDEEESILTPVVEEAKSEEIGEETIVEDSSKKVEQETIVEDSNTPTSTDSVKNVAEEKKDEKVEVIEQVEEITPVLIDSVKKINFASNLKNYRSPRKAMFRSLLLPGWGQAYAKKEWKTAIFAGVEVGAIIGIAVMNYLGDEKGKEAVDFAQANYSKDNFVKFYQNYVSYVRSVFDNDEQYDQLSSTQIDSMVDAEIVQDMFLGDSISNFINNTASVEVSDMWGNRGEKPNNYIAGWNDFSDSPEDLAATGYYFDNTGYHLDNTKYSFFDQDTTWLINNLSTKDKGILGYSNLRLKYLDLREEEDSYYDRKTLFIGLLILNHVVSAVDAFISAKAYNDEMLEKESVWQHIGLENKYAYSENSGFKTTLGLKIKF